MAELVVVEAMFNELASVSMVEAPFKRQICSFSSFKPCSTTDGGESTWCREKSHGSLLIASAMIKADIDAKYTQRPSLHNHGQLNITTPLSVWPSVGDYGSC
eukprot:m.36164 g.36164  ORF g.36164 m.36164 type:complete len:102 (+) comp12454_c0_seq1:852-1157(+)